MSDDKKTPPAPAPAPPPKPVPNPAFEHHEDRGYTEVRDTVAPPPPPTRK